MSNQVSLKKTYVDQKHSANHYTVTVTNPLHDTTEVVTVWTNEYGDGLWIDGKQVEGTCQFSAGKNPAAAIRRYFAKS